VEVIFTQFERTAGRLGRGRARVRCVGCPVRAGLTDGDADEARRRFALRADRRTLLVAPGSQGAANVNRAAARLRPALDELADGWQVLHVAGPGNGQSVRAAYEGAKIHHMVLDFCERMDLAYAVADLALCRAGASTVAELAATSTPAVLMPYPYHRDQHQRHNAAELVAAGAGVVVADATDPAANADSLRRRMLPLMREPARLEAMRSAAAGLGRPAAAEEIARWLAALKQNRRPWR